MPRRARGRRRRRRSATSRARSPTAREPSRRACGTPCWEATGRAELLAQGDRPCPRAAPRGLDRGPGRAAVQHRLPAPPADGAGRPARAVRVGLAARVRARGGRRRAARARSPPLAVGRRHRDAAARPGARRRAARGGDGRRSPLDEPAVAHPRDGRALPAGRRGDRVRRGRVGWPPMIDLRSDTVTLPTAAMRRAMAEAPLGDDQFGEDPSVNALQERVAALLGKEAALFVPTGTMANQLPLKLFCAPGDDVVVGAESHAVWHETGAAAANAGVQFTTVGSGGLFTAEELRAVLKPRGHLLYPPTTLVEVEDTHNRMGGLVWDRAELEAVAGAAREHGAASYLDGARLLNAAAARNEAPAGLAAPFDLVSIALSKGLGCPGGSVLAGRRDDVTALVRYRRMLGGAMRQAGVLAAAGLYALDHHVERLPEDHANARAIGERLAGVDGVRIDLDALETNIVLLRLGQGAPDAATAVARARERDVLVMAFAPRTVRAVTHLDVGPDDCAAAADVLADCVSDAR